MKNNVKQVGFWLPETLYREIKHHSIEKKQTLTALLTRWATEGLERERQPAKEKQGGNK